MENLGTIATFSTAFEAELLQKKIEDLGYFCVIQDVNVINMNFFYANALGGIKVQVDSELIEEIKSKLEEENFILNDDSDIESSE